MAQLRSFKYLEGSEGGAPADNADANSSDRLREEDSQDQLPLANSNEERTSSLISTRSSSNSSQSTTTSATTATTTTTRGGASTTRGGNLTTDSASSQSSSIVSVSQAAAAAAGAVSRRSSADESQSARVDLGEEEEEEEDLEVGEQVREDKENITKIEVGQLPISEEGQKKKKIDQSSEQQAGRTSNEILLNSQVNDVTPRPQAPRLKIFMQRSQTSPTQLGQQQAQVQAMPMSKSPRIQVHGLNLNVANNSFMLQAPNSPAVGGGGNKRAPSPLPDNTSQFSYGMQQRNTQFEIRWHNVKLHARPKSRLPSSVTSSLLYRTLFKSRGGGDEEKLDGDLEATTCYSPALQHKIPPTIDEIHELRGNFDELSDGLEMRNNNTKAPLNTSKLASEMDGNGATTRKARCILNNVSGQVFSGQMTAILGPSGVGKTTLLNSLTGRNELDGTGSVRLIGANDSKRMSVVTVPQMDVLPGKLTTLEDLQFTSRIKNPQARFDHKRNIERIVKCLHMEKFLHTRIDKLSGGEARRLSIGRELLSSPDIMILDEPTSGLDANTCKKIITALREIVEHSDNILDKPMSIIITIHQPQQEVYNIFHRIYVMATGGRVIYEGSPQLLLPTLLEHSSLNRVRPLDQLNENPAIVAIEVASGEFGPQLIDELAAYHENQVYEEFVLYNSNGINPNGGIGSLALDSPLNTPRSLRQPHKSPLSVSRLDMSLHRKRLNSFDSSIGRPTPILTKRQLAGGVGVVPMDRMSSMTSLSYASTYDGDLPQTNSKLKVDKRLRRSVVMKSHFWSHTLTLSARCWLLTKRDKFLMAIRIIGFLMVAGGTVQIFSHALDPEEHQCPQFESEVDDMYAYIGQVRTRLLGLLGVLRQGNSTHLFFFHLLLCITMVTSALAGLVFPLQMRMFMREYKNGWYSPASFITSQTIAELPADLIGPIISIIIAYPLCHQPQSAYYWREIGYAMVFVFASIICKSQAQIVGAFLMDSVENSVFISCVAVTPPALLSGIPLRIEQMIPPMQWASYGSFLRYSFESLLSLRYGYGMCPCDPELVNGYPMVASARAIPPHLENLAMGLLALNEPSSNSTTMTNLNLINETATTTVSSLATGLATSANLLEGGERENLFLRFIRLITDAGNMFIGGEQIGDCKNYRSLYLIGMNISKDALINWIPVMLLMFVISRFLTYFAVKTVIKLRRN